MRRIKAKIEFESEAGTSSRKKNQRTFLGAVSTSVSSICKVMKKVAKEKSSTTDKLYVVSPKS